MRIQNKKVYLTKSDIEKAVRDYYAVAPGQVICLELELDPGTTPSLKGEVDTQVGKDVH